MVIKEFTQLTRFCHHLLKCGGHKSNLMGKTFEMLMSYSFLTADLIWCLFALMSQMKTRVLLSSIFFMADSVVKGCLMML